MSDRRDHPKWFAVVGYTRSVDGQVEWLDDRHVLYFLPRPGIQPEIDDVWSVPTSGAGSSMRLIPEASSPAVVR